MIIILGIVLVFVCSYLGYCFSVKYRDKRIFFQDLYNFNNNLLSEVSFGRNSLKKILKDKDKSLFYGLVNDITINNKKVEKNKNFNDAEWGFLLNYLEKIGQNDSETEKNFLTSVKEKIYSELQNSILNEKKYKSLFIKLGFLIGLIIFIILL